MKKYEWFNQLESSDDSPEMQAVGMILEKIGELEGIKLKIGNEYKNYFNDYVKWLNTEHKPKED